MMTTFIVVLVVIAIVLYQTGTDCVTRHGTGRYRIIQTKPGVYEVEEQYLCSKWFCCYGKELRWLRVVKKEASDTDLDGYSPAVPLEFWSLEDAEKRVNQWVAQYQEAERQRNWVPRIEKEVNNDK